ncbi:uncharacterized protein B0H18DRAFT_976555 [Fomitopsis serialis]|uniref:uncharacterized protein n=1 Tax=Fomitopsis serialis TaxID=139415 RepID=UPI002008CA10|nr:uncharacterized protein B0H18DRAFT_976555 [Neoantrodia serialis]KAH9935624.1 hypothetical protein B0H18DRAFT_976555 [Neoantrodia serialis]
MPRNHNAGPSTLRNRNRVTNKTRLKVITESIDADPIVLDEDEHHLQAVLSAAATRHQSTGRYTRGKEKEKPAPAAYIPTPDSTGLVDNYEELYTPGRWKDPSTYLKFSDTRDKEWLDRNNAEAGGEGTSAQGAMSGTGTRSGRGSKAKGKDPDVPQPVAMSEDEFELVMAIFEKVTHEKTEFLHHGLEQGTPFPPFNDYQDTFAEELNPSMFALYSVPDWVPTQFTFLDLLILSIRIGENDARNAGGTPLYPQSIVSQLDEMDTKNESYICFRRREIKAIRKTRAQQATYSDKMARLQAELTTASDMATGVLRREQLKRDASAHSNAVWKKRCDLVDLKRKFPSLGTKEDEELFHDKERVAKKPKPDIARIPLKLRTRDNGELPSPVAHAEMVIRPKERQAQIQHQIEQDLAKRKEKDQKWEDYVDNPYQPPPLPYACKLYKFFASSRSSSSSELSASSNGTAKPLARPTRAGRIRFGRGGRVHLDRRSHSTHLSDSSSSDDDVEEEEHKQRLAERWKFDADDVPAVGPDGPEEKDRVLIDDYEPKYLVHHMTLLSEQDMASLMPDPTLTVTSSDGRQQTITPFRPGSQGQYGRSMPQVARQLPAPMTPARPLQSLQSSSSGLSISQAGTPVSVATQLKQMAPPAIPHMRISSSGGIRVPGLPTVPAINMQAPLANHDANGHADSSDRPAKSPALQSPRSQQHGSPEQQTVNASSANSSPVRAKAQPPQAITMPTVPNGYHIPSVNAYSAAMPNATYMHANNRPNGLTLQQMQTMKSAYASMSPPPDNSMQANTANGQLRTPASYLGHVLQNGHPNYAAQLANARHMQQWAAATAAHQQQRPPSANAADGNAVDGMHPPAMSPPISTTPVRTPSANGMRTPMSRGMAVPGAAHAMGQPQGRASPANPHMARMTTPLTPSPHLLNSSLAVTQPQGSPTRSPQPPMASPSLQARQAVGSSGAGSRSLWSSSSVSPP